MKNEKILILGDSYSTFKGCVPEGFALYYPAEWIPSVDEPSKTWWHMLATETNSEIALNNSWSGSTICYTGYDGDCSKTSSFIHRLNVLIDEGFFEKNKIDRVLVLGGSNDTWSGALMGELKFSDWTHEDLFCVLPAACCLASKLMELVPKEKIHFIINCDLRENVMDGYAAVCTHYGIGYTQLKGIEKFSGHPTYTGMCQIKDQVLGDLD